MTYLKNPPIFPTDYTAKEIVSDANLKKFREHYAICTSGTNQGEFPDKRLDKEIGAGTRKAIAETYQHLRDHGYYPIGLTQDGRVRVAIQTKSECQILFEKGMDEYKGKSLDELKHMARSGYNPLIKSVTVAPKTRDEMDFQRETAW